MTQAVAPPNDPWTIRKVLGFTTGHFEKKGVDAPRLTAEVLLAHTLQIGRVRLYVDLDRPLDPKELASFRALIERRAAGEPTQYLTGVREFYNRPFRVDPRVLIPRPETELLVEAVVRALPKDAPSRVLDLCTGSGCVALSVAAELPQASVLATDVSPAAIEVASQNAEALGLGSRVTVRQGDLFAAVPEQMRFDVVVANPPYIASSEIGTLSAEVRKEPRLALDGGADGLDFFRRICAGALPVLKAGGLLALELGDTQGPAVRTLLEQSGYAQVRVDKDLERRDRLAFGQKP